MKSNSDEKTFGVLAPVSRPEISGTNETDGFSPN
jgi:hypothetical protein